MTDTQTSEWIEHDGKGMPVSGGDCVAVKFRDGDTMFPLPAEVWHAGLPEYSNWHANGNDHDIVAYRVVKP